ncbi:MAG: translation initiation factor IF-2 [Deltaproteobacteria bacterium]|nr:translation initiation factor IF-2 [Deltaproteobacteria bacterium]
MKKMRVFELSKDLDIDSRELLKIAKDLAISVENTMSLLDTHDIERIKKRLEKIRVQEHQEEPAEDEGYVEKRVAPNVIRRRAKPTLHVARPKPKEVQPSKEVPRPDEQVEAEQIKEKAPVESAEEVVTEKAEEQPLIEETETQAIAPEKEKPEAEKVPGELPREEAKVLAPEDTGPVQVVEAVEEKEKAEEKQKKKEKKKGKAKDKGVEASEAGKPKAKKKVVKKEKQVFSGKDLYDEGHVPLHGRKPKKAKRKKVSTPVPPVKKKLKIANAITVGNLAKEMGMKVSEVISTMMDLGMIATQNQYIDAEDAMIVATELGCEVEVARDEIKEDILNVQEYNPKDMGPRPPVVTVMGHVDHGKTSILDAIRRTNVTQSEEGGITQHIGAYQVTYNGRKITFIDTPGHEAFTAMRARGAMITDFVVLVVAADDGVMDQTKEAINHAKNASIPILVAINKIDKPNANPQRVKEQLSDLGLVPEEWGGDTLFVEVSAKKRIGLEDLLEAILLQAEMLDLKAALKGKARGIVLEARIDKGRGPVCTVLVQNGVLKRGDALVVGMQWGKVRAMLDFTGSKIKEAGPATPVEILGISDIPAAGDQLIVVPSEKKAREVIDYLKERKRAEALGEEKAKMTLDSLYGKIEEGEIATLNLIVKADVHGSVEAIVGALRGIETRERLKINVIHSAVGGITENDVLLASTSNAIIVGFNVRPEAKVRDSAKRYGVEIKLYTVIYDLVDDIKLALKGMLEPEYKEVSLGTAEVREVFSVPKVGVVAGCMVTDGKIERGALARLVRDSKVAYEGKIASLRRFKDDVSEVASGYECGVGLENFNDIKVGDLIEAYKREEKEVEL